MSDISRTLVILGAGGDLTARLLLPGVGQFLASSRGKDIQLIGAGFDPMTDEEWRKRVATSFKTGEATGDRVETVAKNTTYIQADVTKPEDLTRIIEACDGSPALYFALPPAITIEACEALEKVKLPADTVLGLEKPFGTDLKTAEELNAQLMTLVPENQIHRVDHFLGKSTVLNLLGLRFANRIFEPIWNGQHIDKVEIVFDEALGLENRAGYYDRAGALTDMIQSHLLLVMALVTMGPPATLDPEDLRGGMAQALRATKLWNDDPAGSTKRARYTAGTIEGRDFLSYADEKGVDPERGTETLAEITVAVENWRWAGVPFTLRSGKAISTRRKEIVVTMREVPHLPGGFKGKAEPERLRISLSPDIFKLDVNINGEDDPFTLDRAELTATFAEGELGPYGEVLAGLMANDPTLSVRGDEVEECWRIVEPVLTAWRKNEVPLDEYQAGTDGPASWTAEPE